MIASIKEKLQKIKGSLDFGEMMDRNSFVTALIILIAIISFCLGRLSGLDSAKREVEIDFPRGQEAAAFSAAFDTKAPAPAKTSGTYVASKNGTRYYLPSCGGANRISLANRVWFDTKAEAESAGYSPASNCAGI